MKISSDELDYSAGYRLLIGAIVPRPIAWISTRSTAGVVNVAPFSAFTMVSSEPPMVGFTVSRRGGEYKDTARNIHETGEYIIHIADAGLVNAVHASSDIFPHDVSEVEVLRLAIEPGDVVSVPRIAAAPVALECNFVQHVTFGRRGSEFMVGEVKMFHVRDDLITNGKIDTMSLNPVCRLAGPIYATIGTTIPKPPHATRSDF